jgi:hypothetical protein
MVVTASVVAPCNVCIFAPSATCESAALNYRPFGQKTIREIFQQASADALACALVDRPLFSRYEVALPWFFAQPLTDEAIDSLQHVPAAIVDCDIFDCESSAIDNVQRALYALSQYPGRSLYLIARRGGCHPKLIQGGLRATSDTQLIHFLEARLWPGPLTEMMSHVDR